MSTGTRRARDSSSDADSDSSHPAKRRKSTPSSKESLPTFNSPCDLVTFKIGWGEEKEEFQVHREIVYYHSPVLDGAFNSTCVEAQSKTYTLTDTHSSTFRLLVQFFYRNALLGLHTSPSSSYQYGLDPKKYSKEEISAVNDKVDEEVDVLTHLWYLADYLLIPRLQNLILEHLERASERFGVVQCPKTAWSAGKKDTSNLLFRYTVDSFAYHAKFGKHREFLKGVPRDVLVELMIAREENEGEPKVEDYFVKEERN